MKTVILLFGVSDGKNKFDEIIKTKYWTWNINPNNVLSVASRELGWDGNRDNRHYEFLEKFSELADEYYNFKQWYIKTMINKMNSHLKANVLVVHGCSTQLAESIKEDCGGFAISIVKTEKDKKYVESMYDKVIVFDENNLEDFEKEVLKTLEILTKEKE